MNNAHLDDEALSAVLDGVADAGEAEHVASCLDCQGRLGSFRAVAAAVAEPVPQRAPRAREQAIAAALEAGGSLRASRRQRVPLWLVGVAAALLAVGVAVPLLGGHGLTGTAKSSTAARSTAAGEPPTTRSAAGEGQAAASGTNSFATAGADLGDQSDPATLTQVLRAQGGVITGSSGSAS
ncbi:MAG: hypothetical protein QOG64_1001, partial [Acidimicrobiaceae bacterium]|nr:hypothetical protein [Acidimicrobiaceae bacterium]